MDQRNTQMPLYLDLGEKREFSCIENRNIYTIIRLVAPVLALRQNNIQISL